MCDRSRSAALFAARRRRCLAVFCFCFFSLQQPPRYRIPMHVSFPFSLINPHRMFFSEYQRKRQEREESKEKKRVEGEACEASKVFCLCVFHLFWEAEKKLHIFSFSLFVFVCSIRESNEKVKASREERAQAKGKTKKKNIKTKSKKSN